jgi:hypothetical protein
MSYYHDDDDLYTNNSFCEENDTKPEFITNPNYLELKRSSNSIRVFASKGIGTNIIDAITGRAYDSRVGSKNEENFYKVMICTGEQVKIVGNNYQYQLKTPLTLFYRYPCEFKEHFLITEEEKEDYE